MKESRVIEKIMHGRTDLVVDFVTKGGDPNALDHDKRPLIISTWYFGDVTATKFLINHGASFSDLGRNMGLNGAAFHGHWQLCQYLLEEGADPNDQLPDTGETPMHACLCSANRPVTNFILEVLLYHRGDPNIKTNPGIETGGFMRDVRTRGETALHRAAAFGDFTTIQLLLDAGADKTAKDANGDTPISWASWHLRPGKILAQLSYGSHSVHPLHIERIRSDHGMGWGSGISINQLGQIINDHT